MNSFGYGGTNSHVIIESLSSFLESTHGSTTELRLANGNTNGVNGINGHSYTNGTNGSNGTRGHSYSNGAHGTNGINGHSTKASPEQLFVLSANTEKSLKASVQKLSDWTLKNKPSTAKLSDISYTLLARRSLLTWRQSIVATGVTT